MRKTLIIILSIIGVILLVCLGLFIYVKVTYLSKDEIKNIVFENTGLNSHDIYFESIDLDMEDNKYDVEFYYNNREYEYKIDAKNGRIIYNDFQNINETNKTTNNPSANNSQNITLDEAKNIALKDAKLNTSDVVFTEAKQELDDGKTVYDIEFYHDYNEYNYEIDVTNGTIISFDKDYR